MNEKRQTIMIVDDDEGIRDTLEAILRQQYNIIKVGDGETALRTIAEKEINVILLDIRLPGIDGLDVLRLVKERYDNVDIIVITAVRDIETAIKAIKLGAYHFISKEFDYDEVHALVNKVLSKQSGEKEILYLKTEMEQFIDQDFIVGSTKRMREIYDTVAKVAKLPATILIQGESGTGKQVIARYIHKESREANMPFVTVDLGALPDTLVESTLFGYEKGAFTGAYKQHPGKFELADGGTLFLDEIGNMRLDLQGKILRAIQEGEIERLGGKKTVHVKVRIIAATNVDLQKAVAKGNFREDLFYRINVLPIKLPPLRERIIDLPQFIHYFMAKYSKRFSKKVDKITKGAINALSDYSWPGNIRELENLIERLVAVADKDSISESDIPIEYYISSLSAHNRKESLLVKACNTFERNFILKTLEREGWNRQMTAETLGIPVSTLKFKLKKLQIHDIISIHRELRQRRIDREDTETI
ncbi:MAG TPA: sigma-54 dependent transcriptional regulator [Nitrospiria bacterium]|nr:sigma-54 dependent transcriptional regulator [Nitrospiria bacterium]